MNTCMYTHYNGTYNNVCMQIRTTVYGRGRGLRGPVGVGWCACDKTNTINHVHALGSEGSAGGPYIMHSASDTIGPGGWGQRSGREPARQVWCV